MTGIFINSGKIFWLVVLISVIFSAVACNPQPSPNLQQPDYWPTDNWRTDAPVAHALDEEKLAAIVEDIPEEVPFLDSLLIVRNGYLVHESYYNGYDESRVHDIASATKSWTSALVGIAQAQGKLASLDEPLSVLLPDYFADEKYADKSTITLRNLLMMRSGIEYDESVLDSGGYGGEELLASDITAIGLGFPMAYQPGETWNYSTLDTQLISAIVQHAVGEPLESYALTNLFQPMGITKYDWWEDATGTNLGGQNLSMTPRDLTKLGLLYLHNGYWDGEQLVPSEWVKLSLTPQDEAYYPPTSKTEIIEWYGYLWWLWKPDWFYGYRSFQAKGYAGQWVLVFPELDLIITTTANQEVDIENAIAQERVLNDLILNKIFPALTDVNLEK